MSELCDTSLYNEDLAAVPLSRRTWTLYNYASLWVAMSVCIPTYMLASGLIAGGMNWWQAVGTILLGNLIVLIPMLLNAHAGARYGIPFPVFVRASFGVRGANVPAVLRALVACGWFGIQTWIGGQAIFTMLQILWPAAKGSSAGMWACFFFFWVLNMLVVWRGIDTIKVLEGVAAPFMLSVGLLMLWWITSLAGGFGPVLSAPSKFHSTGDFVRFFIPSLTGMVGFWATVNLNPRRISFRPGGLITGCVGILMMPWKLLGTFSSYIFGWLVGYSGLLGPIAGIMIADYFVYRRCELVVGDLYRRGGRYEYSSG